ncbi:MAG: hypothetical protein RLZZ293_985 [Pseudomonadota bacterium]
MVAGAAIGSGVLALPIMAAGPGIINTLIFTTISFIFAYLMATVSIDVYARYDNPDINAASLAVEFFGRKGYWFSTVINVLSMGALAAAYVNAGGDLLTKTILPLMHIHVSSTLGMGLFFIIFIPVFAIGLGLVSGLNSIIFSIKYICLVLGIILGLHLVKPSIFEIIPSGLKYIGTAASTFYCIWMMHMILPVILKMNDWKPAPAKKAVLIGLLIPAAVYAGWLMLILSLIPRHEFAHLETIGDVMSFALAQPNVPNLIDGLIRIFSSITVLTAFLSIGFSLVAFTIDALKWKNTYKSRTISTIISFALPVGVALIFPKAFIIIYQQANMLNIAAALIPVAAGIIYNRKHKLSCKPELSVMIFSILIIIAQLIDNFSLFPKFS